MWIDIDMTNYGGSLSYKEVLDYYLISEDYYSDNRLVSENELTIFTEDIIKDNILDYEQLENIIFYLTEHDVLRIKDLFD